MSLVSLDGGLAVPIGPNFFGFALATPGGSPVTLDAANEACVAIGQVMWADGGSHTIDTTGSSSIGWKSVAVTFANAGTTVKIGVGAVDTTTGPPARAANVANVITFDVSSDQTGGGGGITSSVWITSVPTTGTKTIATGDLVAVSIQMTARGGADSVIVNHVGATSAPQRPAVTSFVGGAYASVAAAPNIILVASDGTIGWIYGSMHQASTSARTWNSTSTPKEYGQLFKLPFPCKVYGIYASIDPDADCDLVLYSDPLGSPVAAKTVSLDLNVTQSATARHVAVMFASPYICAAEQPVVAAFKPSSASDVSTTYRTLHSATYRVVDAGGVDSYGVSRDAGVFSDANSSLDHYLIGLLVGGFGPSAIATGLHPIDGGMA